MITKIYLVRHTQTVGNVEKRLTGRKDYEVTEKGCEYINKLTEKLKEIKFDIAYASTSKRTSKTIEKIAKINNIEIIEDENLCEMNFGIYDGMLWDEVNRINPEINKLHIETNEIMNIPEQETTNKVAERMYNYIRKISIENIGKTILISSHGVAIEAFLRKVTGEEFSIKREEYSQKNTSLNILEYDDILDKFELIKLNDYSHLA